MDARVDDDEESMLELNVMGVLLVDREAQWGFTIGLAESNWSSDGCVRGAPTALSIVEREMGLG